jgi:methylglyoxal synthase
MQHLSRQWIGKHVPVATNMHTIELLLKTVFSTQSVQRGYKEDNWGKPVS